MTLSVIGIGTVAGDGTGDGGRIAFGKVNTNFAELYGNADYLGVDSGIVNAYTVLLATLKPNPIASPLTTAGCLLRFLPLNTNTGAATLNGVALVRPNGTALSGGEVSSAGPVVVQYTGTQWQIVATCGAQPGFERTPQELAGAVIPSNYAYPPGNPWRYGADGTGGANDTTALATALTVATVTGVNGFKNGTLFSSYLRTAAEVAAAIFPVNYEWPPGYVDRYGTNTTPGTTNMTTAINNAIAVVKQMGAGEIVFQPGVDYFVVPTASGPTGLTACTLSAMSNVTIRGRARIVSNTSVISIPVIFLLQDCNQVTVDGLRFYDTGANISVDFQGPWAIYATTTTANDCGGIHVKDVETQNILGPFAAVLWTGTGRVRGIHFTNLKADACYYGTPSLQENGDAVTGSVIVNNCRRAGFPYGISGVNMTYDIWHDAVSVGANATLDIKRYKRDTTGIKIRASFHGSPVQFGSLVNFETQATLANLGITAFGALTAGAGYTNGWYANVPLTGGTGTGATATLEFSGGALVAAFIGNRGNGYLNTDSLSFSNASVGGAGSGAAIAVSTVGGTVSGVDIDLDLSGCTFPDPTVTATTPFPVQFRSLTPGGVLNTTTNDVWDGITIRGNLGDWSFAQPGQTPQAINILSTQLNAPGRLHLGGDFFGNFGGNPPVYPGFVVRTAIDTDVYTKVGDLTAAPMFVDLSRYDGYPIALRITIHAVLNNHSGGNAINNEYIISATKAAGAAIANLTVTAGLANTIGAAPDVPAFAASGNGLNVTHTNYNNAASYCRMSVQHLTRFAGSQ